MECWISVSYLKGTLLIVQLKLMPYDGAGAISSTPIDEKRKTLSSFSLVCLAAWHHRVLCALRFVCFSVLAALHHSSNYLNQVQSGTLPLPSSHASAFGHASVSSTHPSTHSTSLLSLVPTLVSPFVLLYVLQISISREACNSGYLLRRRLTFDSFSLFFYSM